MALHPHYLPSPDTSASLWKGLAPSLSCRERKVWPGWGAVESQSKQGIPTHSLKHTPSLSQTKTHTQSSGHHPRATHCRPLSLYTPRNLLPGVLHLRTQPGPGGEVHKLPKPRIQQLQAHIYIFLGTGGTLHSSPLSVAKGALPPLPSGAGELHPNPRAGMWGGGREEEGAAPPTETQRDVLQPRLHGDAGEGAVRTRYFLSHLQG